jgi:hypothetical protein
MVAFGTVGAPKSTGKVAIMRRLDVALRWLGAIGITLAPLGIFVLPGLLHPEPYETAEDQFAAIAEGTGSEYLALGLQIFGAAILVAAALGIGGCTIGRGRGRTLGAIGLITGMVTAIVLLVVLGYELAMQTVLISATDTDAAVSQVVVLSASPMFEVPLLVGLLGFFLTLPLLALALWRSRIVPILVPLLFALPVLIGFVPLPVDTTVLGGVLMLIPCLWMSVQLIRGAVTKASTDDATVETSWVAGRAQ